MSVEISLIVLLVTLAMNAAAFFATKHSLAKRAGEEGARVDERVKVLERKSEEHGQRFGKIFDKLEKAAGEAIQFSADLAEIRRLLDEVRGDVKRILLRPGTP